MINITIVFLLLMLVRVRTFILQFLAVNVLDFYSTMFF